MRIRTIDTGMFKLDGGGMFGVVPKRMWAKLNPPDANNMCSWSMRCLLIEAGDRKILVDTGIGSKQDDKFRSHFEPSGQENLTLNLMHAGLQPSDITDVFLTHLHFDHVGGALDRSGEGTLIPAFPNARYWTNQAHLSWAMRPNAREAASFLPENFMPLQAMGRLSFIEASFHDTEWLPGIYVRFLYGHTEAMMALLIRTGSKTVVYCADLIPSSHHVGLPYVMAYDVRPLITLEEKERLLNEAVEGDYILVFEHDLKVEAAFIDKSASGKFAIARSGDLQELLS